MTGKTVFLRPGEWRFSTTGGIVKTILGSCVAVTMFSANPLAGAICHAMMPKPADTVSSGECARYVTCIMDEMFDRFTDTGVTPSEIEIKLFGGADMMKSRTGVYSIGRNNIETARRKLESMGLPVTNSATGGNSGMVLLFDMGTGDVFMRHITKTEPCVIEPHTGLPDMKES